MDSTSVYGLELSFGRIGRKIPSNGPPRTCLTRVSSVLGQTGWELVIFDWFVLSMRMQFILDSPFAHPGSAPVGGVKKGEFRDWARVSSGIAELSSLISLNDLSEGGGGGGGRRGGLPYKKIRR